MTINSISIIKENNDFVKPKNTKQNRRLTQFVKILTQYNGAIPRNRYIDRAKIAITGGGIAGTVAALHLVRNGVMVDLFEKEKAIFMGSSAIPAHLYSGVQYFDDMIS